MLLLFQYILLIFIFSFASCCYCHTFVHPLSLIDVERCNIELGSAITIDVNPKVLNGLAGWVNVSYYNPNPAADDWIGFYAPSSVNFTASAPALYVWASADPEYLRTGNGVYQFHVINMRSDSIFAFMQHGLSSPSLSALSSPLVFSQASAPMHPRLALTAKVGQLLLSWTQLPSASPRVVWGTSSNIYEYSANAVSTSYTREELCGAPATTVGWRDPGVFYSALLDNLVEGKLYFYRFGDAEGLYSEEYTFVGPAVSSVPASPWTAFLFGDLGAGTLDNSKEFDDSTMQASLNTTKGILDDLKELRQADPAHQAIVMHNGDISYASGYGSHWELFHNEIAPIAGTLPWMTSEGNHERDFPNSGDIFGGTDSGGECGIPYQLRFPMPRPALLKDWYSVEFQNVHFLVFNTEMNFTKGSEQYEFIANDLAAVDRSKTPFVIAMCHRPQYVDSSNYDKPSGDQTVAVILRQHIEPLFHEFRVDLSWYGHHHEYTRTCPVYQEKCVPQGEFGTVHVVSGAAGCGLSQNLLDKPPQWLEYINDVEHGYMKATIFGDRIEFVFLVGADRQVRDQFTLYKQQF